MSNKRLRVSDDSGATWFTLPGNQADYKTEFNAVTDTIFGQTYESQFPGIGQWNMTANAVVKGVAGYNAKISKGGTPTSATDEATTNVTGKIYQITNVAHRWTSIDHPVTVKDGATDVTAQVQSYDYMTGTVTFLSSYTVVGVVTVDLFYMPMAVVAKAKSFTVTQTQTAIDETGYDDAQADTGFRIFAAGLKTVQIQLGNIFKASNGWADVLTGRTTAYVECDLDASNPGKNIFRGIFKGSTRDQSGNQGAVEDESVTLNLYVPDNILLLQPFGWYIDPTSTLNQSVQKSLTAFINQTTVDVQYLPSGAVGQTPLDGAQGTAVVIEATIANTLDGINTFSFNYRGTGAVTDV